MADDPLHRRMMDAVLGSDDRAREELERELADRPEARAEYERLRRAWEELGGLPVDDPPAGARHRAEEAFLRAVENEPRRAGRGMPWGWAAAAGILLFLGGTATGLQLRSAGPAGPAGPAATGPPGVPGPEAEAPVPSVDGPATVADDPEPHYVLLIRSAPAADAAEEQAQVAAMTAWSRDLWSRDRLVWAERLEEGASLRVGPDPDAPVSGLFVVRAEDREQAIAYARESPHLAWGGAVEVLPTAGAGGG